jgi:hypothetical protein
MFRPLLGRVRAWHSAGLAGVIEKNHIACMVSLRTCYPVRPVGRQFTIRGVGSSPRAIR